MLTPIKIFMSSNQNKTNFSLRAKMLPITLIKSFLLLVLSFKTTVKNIVASHAKL